jgi:hypothetical protein
MSLEYPHGNSGDDEALLAPASQRYSYGMSCITFLVHDHSASIHYGCAYIARTAACVLFWRLTTRVAIPSQSSTIIEA